MKWLNDFSLVGNPPDAWPYTVNLILTAQNKYQKSSDFFVIHVNPNTSFILKSLAAYISPVVGVLSVWAYWILLNNIFCKKRYRYKKKFYLTANKKITTLDLYPICFMNEYSEKKDDLLTNLRTKLKMKNNDKLFRQYYTPPFTSHLGFGNFDLDKFMMDLQFNINDGKLKSKEANTQELIIQQLIIDDIVMWELKLPENYVIRKTFNTLKKRWYNYVKFVEPDGGEEVFFPIFNFSINIPAIKTKLKGIRSKILFDLEEKLASYNEKRRDKKKSILDFHKNIQISKELDSKPSSINNFRNSEKSLTTTTRLIDKENINEDSPEIRKIHTEIQNKVTLTNKETILTFSDNDNVVKLAGIDLDMELQNGYDNDETEEKVVPLEINYTQNEASEAILDSMRVEKEEDFLEKDRKKDLMTTDAYMNVTSSPNENDSKIPITNQKAKNIMDDTILNLPAVSEFQIKDQSKISEFKNEKPKSNEHESNKHNVMSFFHKEGKTKQKYNIELLFQALLAHSRKEHNIKLTVQEAKIGTYIYKPRTTFCGLKAIFDLFMLNFKKNGISTKFNSGLGIKYELNNNTLVFKGVPQEKIIGKSFVIRISDTQNRILNEYWCSGVEGEDHDKGLLDQDINESFESGNED